MCLSTILNLGAAHGFAKVVGTAIDQVAAVLDIQMPSDTPEKEVDERKLAAIIMTILPELKQADLVRVMLEASIKNEDTEDAALAELGEEVVNDVCLVGEVPEVKIIMQTRTSQVEARRGSRQRVKRVVALAYGSVKEVTATARQAAAAKRAAAKAAVGQAKEVEKLRSRWLADLRADPTGVVVGECPAVASIFPDNNNGRFLVSARDRFRKSYSWTVRGMDEAARLALTQAWLWSEEMHGIPPPPHVCLQ